MQKTRASKVTLLSAGSTIPKWRAHSVSGWETLSMPAGHLNVVTATLINLTPVLGISQISQKNAPEAWFRLAVLQSVAGPILTDTAGAPVFFTRQDVYRHIGLETEAKDIPLEEFLRSMLGIAGRLEEDGGYVANSNRTALQVMRVDRTG